MKTQTLLSLIKKYFLFYKNQNKLPEDTSSEDIQIAIEQTIKRLIEVSSFKTEYELISFLEQHKTMNTAFEYFSSQLIKNI